MSRYVCLPLKIFLCLHQHSKGYTVDGFYRSEDPTNNIKVLKKYGLHNKQKIQYTDTKKNKQIP